MQHLRSSKTLRRDQDRSKTQCFWTTAWVQAGWSGCYSFQECNTRENNDRPTFSWRDGISDHEQAKPFATALNKSIHLRASAHCTAQSNNSLLSKLVLPQERRLDSVRHWQRYRGSCRVHFLRRKATVWRSSEYWYSKGSIFLCFTLHRQEQGISRPKSLRCDALYRFRRQLS